MDNDGCRWPTTRPGDLIVGSTVEIVPAPVVADAFDDMIVTLEACPNDLFAAPGWCFGCFACLLSRRPGNNGQKHRGYPFMPHRYSEKNLL
jgi:hypothetical protein